MLSRWLQNVLRPRWLIYFVVTGTGRSDLDYPGNVCNNDGDRDYMIPDYAWDGWCYVGIRGEGQCSDPCCESTCTHPVYDHRGIESVLHL